MMAVFVRECRGPLSVTRALLTLKPSIRFIKRAVIGHSGYNQSSSHGPEGYNGRALNSRQRSHYLLSMVAEETVDIGHFHGMRLP